MQCNECGTEDDLTGVTLLHNLALCHHCDPIADTTYCGVCGIIAYRDDLRFASNGDGPNCPDCTKLVEVEIALAHSDALDDGCGCTEDADEFYGDFNGLTPTW